MSQFKCTTFQYLETLSLLGTSRHHDKGSGSEVRFFQAQKSSSTQVMISKAQHSHETDLRGKRAKKGVKDFITAITSPHVLHSKALMNMFTTDMLYSLRECSGQWEASQSEASTNSGL